MTVRRTAGGGVAGVRRAFTLIECLVSVTLAAVLIALAVPALRGARHEAHNTRSIANLRTHAGTLQFYLGDWRDDFPAFMDPRARRTTFFAAGEEITGTYFESFYLWQFALAEQYYEGKLFHDSFRRPHDRAWFAYYYSCSFIASPEYWSHATRRGADQWRGVRAAETVFPAHKGVVVEIGEPPPHWPANRRGEPVRMAFADGSAQAATPGALVPPVDDGDGRWENDLRGRTYHSLGMFGCHTVDGVRGRDVRER